MHNTLSELVVTLITSEPASQPLTGIDGIVKLAAAVVTGVAAAVGLPIAFLTIRKTRAEIIKLELETNALRRENSGQIEEGTPSDDESNRSPHATSRADANRLAVVPILILLDFMLAWIALYLAGRFFSWTNIGRFDDVVLTILALALLLPIAREILRLRSVLRPSRTPAEISGSLRDTRILAVAVYTALVVSALGAGLVILIASPDNLTDVGRVLGWSLIGLFAVLLALYPSFRKRLAAYLSSVDNAAGDSVPSE